MSRPTEPVTVVITATVNAADPWVKTAGGPVAFMEVQLRNLYAVSDVSIEERPAVTP